MTPADEWGAEPREERDPAQCNIDATDVIRMLDARQRASLRARAVVDFFGDDSARARRAAHLLDLLAVQQA